MEKCSVKRRFPSPDSEEGNDFQQDVPVRGSAGIPTEALVSLIALKVQDIIDDPVARALSSKSKVRQPSALCTDDVDSDDLDISEPETRVTWSEVYIQRTLDLPVSHGFFVNARKFQLVPSRNHIFIEAQFQMDVGFVTLLDLSVLKSQSPLLDLLAAPIQPVFL
ncbi:hypothetical protein NDU88_010822 [Pleurodeles waltl]|uniref:Uncharacterized protein n=1 Tax=Pleurodeles waltl TaxID=8319 RepID=A0AAV7QVH1_PLEWA|nr:hypothetical protein NDU88_010822 [Pleurodeles waltl]